MGSQHSSVGGRHGRRLGGWLRQLVEAVLVLILVRAVPRAVSPVALVSVVLDSVSSPSGAVKNNTETRERDRDRQRENSNSKTLIHKDSSVRSIWTYLTASPCYSNTSKQEREYPGHMYSSVEILLILSPGIDPYPG